MVVNIVLESYGKLQNLPVGQEQTCKETRPGKVPKGAENDELGHARLAFLKLASVLS